MSRHFFIPFRHGLSTEELENLHTTVHQKAACEARTRRIHQKLREDLRRRVLNSVLVTKIEQWRRIEEFVKERDYAQEQNIHYDESAQPEEVQKAFADVDKARMQHRAWMQRTRRLRILRTSHSSEDDDKKMVESKDTVDEPTLRRRGIQFKKRARPLNSSDSSEEDEKKKKQKLSSSSSSSSSTSSTSSSSSSSSSTTSPDNDSDDDKDNGASVTGSTDNKITHPSGGAEKPGATAPKESSVINLDNASEMKRNMTTTTDSKSDVMAPMFQLKENHAKISSGVFTELPLLLLPSPQGVTTRTLADIDECWNSTDLAKPKFDMYLNRKSPSGADVTSGYEKLGHTNVPFARYQQKWTQKMNYALSPLVVTPNVMANSFTPSAQLKPESTPEDTLHLVIDKENIPRMLSGYSPDETQEKASEDVKDSESDLYSPYDA